MRQLAKLSPMRWIPGIDWNHNLFYHPYLLRRVPAHAERALDVGCGTGAFARDLAAHAATVDAIDRHEPSLVLARERTTAPNVTYRNVDLLTDQLEPSSYDFISCIAVIHHMPFLQAAAAMRDLLAPGGVLAIVGLNRQTPADLAYAAITVPLDVVMGIGYRVTRGRSVIQEAPIREPEMTADEIKRAAHDVLPGATYRRHVFYRYSLVYRHA